jgi:alpha-1,2-glucosyltransferase
MNERMVKPDHHKRNTLIVFFLFFFVALAMWASIIFWGSSSYADESAHMHQLKMIIKGDYSIASDITTIPGYHAAVYSIAKTFFRPKHMDMNQFRFISIGLSLISILAFYLLARKFKARNPSIKTLQFIFLPISFFYFPLLYTDIFSLLLVLFAFYFVLGKHHTWSALFSLASIAVRQTNIVWAAFFWIYAYVQENGFSFSWEKLKIHAEKTVGYLIVFLLFILFLWFNKGIAVGDQEMQRVGLHAGNLYFFLAMIGFLFFPVLVSSLVKFDRSKLKELAIASSISAAIALLFLILPPAIHGYNLKMRFLRNIALSLAYAQYSWAYALAIFTGCITIYLMKFEKKLLLLFPFAALSLVPSLLVEQRYLIVPIVLMLLFRKELSRKTELILFFYFFLLSSGLLWIILKLGIFL